VPEGAYVPQGGTVPVVRPGVSPPARPRTPFELQAERIKNRLQARLLEEIDDSKEEDPEQVARRIIELLNSVITELGITLTKPERQRLQDSVLHDFLGLGPIESLVNDPHITEIMVNGHAQVFIEQKGKLTLSDVQFESDDQLRRVIERIVSTIGRLIDESSPMVDARLKDGSRVNVIIPPLALNGPILTIR
jgi:pilus assembly protein CpaF